MSGQVSRGSAGEYLADERAGVVRGGGQPAVKSEVRAQSNTVGRLRFFWGGDVREYPGGLRESVIDREAWHAAVHGVAKLPDTRQRSCATPARSSD